MQLLYIASACKEVEGKKLLLPGFLVVRGGMDVKPSDKIKVELSDGTMLETTVQGTQPLIFDQNLMQKLNLHVPSGFYYAIEVPHDFSSPGIERAANVSLMD